MLRARELPTGFEILWQERVVVSHTSAQPLLSLGRGIGQYKMRHGSFKIKDRVQERFTPKIYALEHRDGGIAACSAYADIQFKIRDGRLEITFAVRNHELNRLWFNLTADADEHIFGGGEQYSTVNLRGRKLPVWCEEQGIGRGRDLITFLAELTHGSGGAWYTTYFPQPTFLSSNCWYCHLDASAYMELDFTGDRHRLCCWQIPRAIIIGQQPDPPALLGDLTSLLGRQPALPDWINDGVWLGVQGGRDVVQAKLQTALDSGVKVAALWCQDWEGIRMTSFGKQLMWDWRFDPQLYPDLPDYAQNLQKQGIRFLGYINPFLALEGELYKVAHKQGYLVQNHQGEECHVKITDFPAAVLDLSNPEAVTWIKGVIKENMLGSGLSGWMADFGEYMPIDAKLHSGESPETFHNRYPAIWAQVNNEAVQEAGREDVTFFSRAGYTGSSRYAPMIWAGDQLVNWSLDDGLASVIPAGISLGLSGIGHFHSDIGGYTTVGWIRRGKELFMRWAEMAVFSTVMRTHEGNRPDANWQFDSDSETLAHFARMSRVHVALKPYIRAALQEYQEQGLPLVRHLWLHYPQDRVASSLKYQYLFGRDLLVAPVYRRGRKTAKVYLPADRWIHLWTGKDYDPGWHFISAPLGQPPVFYRFGSSWAPLFIKLMKQ